MQELVVNAIGNFLGGMLVTCLFFFVDIWKHKNRTAEVRTARLLAIKSELYRLRKVSTDLNNGSIRLYSPIDISFIRVLLAEEVSDPPIPGLGPAFSALQSVIDELNSTLMQQLAELTGIQRTLSGFEVRNIEINRHICEVACNVVGCVDDVLNHLDTMFSS